jgi:hypothetical protein
MGKLFRVIFCGKGHFVSSFDYTKQYLQQESTQFLFEQCSYDHLEDKLKGLFDSSRSTIVMSFLTKMLMLLFHLWGRSLNLSFLKRTISN